MQHPGRESRHRHFGGSELLRVLARYDRKGALKLVRLWRGWEDVVGPEVAELARPLGHKDGTLLLHVQDAVAAQQLSYYAPEILERVNGFLGEECFDKVRFELLNGRVPLDGNRGEAPRAPAPAVRKPPALGGLVGRLDPESAVGRCYLAYVRRFAEGVGQDDGQAAGQPAGQDANTRPNGASRRRT